MVALNSSCTRVCDSPRGEKQGVKSPHVQRLQTVVNSTLKSLTRAGAVVEEKSTASKGRGGWGGWVGRGCHQAHTLLIGRHAAQGRQQ